MINDAPCFTVSGSSILVRVKAKPHAREDAVLGARGGELLVSVRAPAEKGRANEEIVKVVARALGVPRHAVTLKTGGSSPHKTLIVPRETEDALRRLSSPA